MAGETSNREELPEETEAAGSKAPGATKTVKKAPKKRPSRKGRGASTKEVRLKAFWGVFSQSLNAVTLFEYGQREEAQKKADELTESRKSPHFVQLVKKVIEE